MAKDPVPSDWLDAYINTLIAFCVLHILSIAGRVYIRARVVKAFGWDDVAAVFTAVRFLRCKPRAGLIDPL